MAWNIPKQIGSLLLGDDVTQRAFGNVQRALQPVLDFCNSSFSLAQNGALQVARNIVTQALTVNGQVVVNGNQVVYGFKGVNNSFVVVPGGPGAAFYVTNNGNTAANFLVNSDGSVFGNNTWSTTSVVSNQGFKSWIRLGSYYNTSTASGDQYFTVEPIVRIGTGTAAYIQRRYICIRPGSLTGVSIWHNNSITVPVTWYIQRNGTTVATLVLAANGLGITSTYPKGTGAFVNNDNFTAICSVATGQNFAATVDIEIEEGA